MITEELVEYLDARMACHLNYYTVDGYSIRFDRSIIKTLEGHYIVQVGDKVVAFEDAASAAACFLKRLEVAA